MTYDHPSTAAFHGSCLEQSHRSVLLGSLQIKGDITYNGATFDEFVPQRTAAYIEQTDLHLPELTVRETMDFAARVQGTGHKAGLLPALPRAAALATMTTIQ